jgi:hypothetical protein
MQGDARMMHPREHLSWNGSAWVSKDENGNSFEALGHCYAEASFRNAGLLTVSLPQDLTEDEIKAIINLMKEIRNA